MNKLFKILSFLLLFVIAFSCSENETKVYNGDYSRSTFLSTNGTVYTLQIVKDDTGTLTIPFGASTLSPNDRTYSIELVEPEDPDTVVADPQTYNLPSSVTIPANEYIGDIVITGQDLGLVDTNAKPFTFRIVGLNETEFMDDVEVTVDVVEVCPLKEGVKYEGIYMLETIVPGAFGDNFKTETILLEYVSEFNRTFKGTFLPNQNSGNGFSGVSFSFSLVCGDVIVTPSNTLVGCGEPRIFFGPAEIPVQYNNEDDSEIIIRFTEDYGACGEPATQCVIKLTKQ